MQPRFKSMYLKVFIIALVLIALVWDGVLILTIIIKPPYVILMDNQR